MYRSLHIDVLEARALPSMAPPLSVPSIDPGGPMDTANPVAGHASGGYSSTIPGVDVGAQYNFLGAGHVAHLGRVTVNGTINCVGNVAQGHATGTITFTSAVNGSVTIAVVGPAQKAFSPLPHQFQYHVVSGTGADQNLHGDGALTINIRILNPPAPAFGRFGMIIH